MANKTKGATDSNKVRTSSKTKKNPACKKKEKKTTTVKQDIIQWYIDNNIEAKKFKTKEEKINEEKDYEEIELMKNVEEYISVLCRIKNDVKQNDETPEGDLDVVKKVSSQKLVVDTFQMGTKDVGNFEYTYDRVYDIQNSNYMIFNDYIKHNIKNVFHGINCSIMAYGQTNSGKTYTMLGNFEFINNLYKLCVDNKENEIIDDKVSLTYEELTNCISKEPHNIGVIPSCINFIFNYINFNKRKDIPPEHKDVKEFTVTLSIIEIYNEIIFDLISGESNLVVQSLDAKSNESVIKNLTEVEIDNIISALYYLEQGVNNRKIAFTNMNKASSRSHLIFIVKIKRFMFDSNTMKNGKLCLVDLAGSERLKQTKATGSVKIEATMINKSLTVLSKVINALAVMQIKEKIVKTGKDNKENPTDTENEDIEHEKLNEAEEKEKEQNEEQETNKEAVKLPKGKSTNTKKVKTEPATSHIPYRDSKLTRVLSDSLGNSCKSILICTLAAQYKYLSETASTIKFAQRAKMVKAKPVVREEKMDQETCKVGIDTKGMKDGINETDKEKTQKEELMHMSNPIFFNFHNTHYINQDVIFFCFTLCIFSYICGSKSTGKTKYMDFFLESYKNQIELMNQQIQKKEESSNDIQEYLLKTFDELKSLTEEERNKYMKATSRKEISNVKETPKEKEREKDLKKEKEAEKENKEPVKLTLQYLNKFNKEQGINVDKGKPFDDNTTKTNLSREDNEDDEDAIIGDILIKMKNDICNILKFSLLHLKHKDMTDPMMKEPDTHFDKIIEVVNKVKEDNQIFLQEYLDSTNKQVDDAQGRTKDKVENIENENQIDNGKVEEVIEPSKGNINAKSGKDGKLNKDTKDIKKKSLKEKLQGKYAKDIHKKGNKMKGEEEKEKKEEENKEIIKKEEEENPLVYASKVLSVDNVRNIFEYINNHFSKFISDFTTDKSTVFTNFDFNENLDRQMIERNETIYNFIHAATMFQHNTTLKNLNSNYFFNKVQTEKFNNVHHNKNLRIARSLNIGVMNRSGSSSVPNAQMIHSRSCKDLKKGISHRIENDGNVTKEIKKEETATKELEKLKTDRSIEELKEGVRSIASMESVNDVFGDLKEEKQGEEHTQKSRSSIIKKGDTENMEAMQEENLLLNKNYNTQRVAFKMDQELMKNKDKNDENKYETDEAGKSPRKIKKKVRISCEPIEIDMMNERGSFDDEVGRKNDQTKDMTKEEIIETILNGGEMLRRDVVRELLDKDEEIKNELFKEMMIHMNALNTPKTEANLIECTIKNTKETEDFQTHNSIPNTMVLKKNSIMSQKIKSNADIINNLMSKNMERKSLVSKEVMTSNDYEEIQKVPVEFQENKETIHVYQNETILEFTHLLENEEFKKLYQYITREDQENVVEFLQAEDEDVCNAIQQLETRIHEEINKISNSIQIDIFGNNKHCQSNELEQGNKNDIIISGEGNIEALKNDQDKNNFTNAGSLTKRFNAMEISYLEKKRNTTVCIKKIFNVFHKIFQKQKVMKDQEIIEAKVIDVLDRELLANKNLLEKNLDSYNIRNFFINNKKIYLLNEPEYVHLNELVNYKNIIISLLNDECKKYKIVGP